MEPTRQKNLMGHRSRSTLIWNLKNPLSLSYLTKFVSDLRNEIITNAYFINKCVEKKMHLSFLFLNYLLNNNNKSIKNAKFSYKMLHLATLHPKIEPCDRAAACKTSTRAASPRSTLPCNPTPSVELQSPTNTDLHKVTT